MPGIRERGEEIRNFILLNISSNRNIASITAQRFFISHQAVYKHIDKLVSEKQLIKKAGRYVLQSRRFSYNYRVDKKLSEDTVWENDIKKHFIGVSDNAKRIWVYGFLEIFNNAIEHSNGKKINVVVEENKVSVSVTISDDGIGIFKNIKTKFKLPDEKDALLELAKGKRTTDNKRHSGQGIFFTSKAFDDFNIVSGGIIFNAGPAENSKKITKTKFSTSVYMHLANNSEKKLKDIFDKYSTEIPGDFDKTIVPIHLAKSDDLVSRSQARRILSGLELFKEVILDFKDIDHIGQAFADEIFRVFPNMYPETKMLFQNTATDVINMINRAKNTKL